MKRLLVFVFAVAASTSFYSQKKISYKINDFQVLKDLNYQGSYFDSTDGQKCEIYEDTILDFCYGRIRLLGYEMITEENIEEAEWECWPHSDFTEELLDENGNLKYKFEVIDNNMFFLYDSVWFQKERYITSIHEFKHLYTEEEYKEIQSADSILKLMK